MIYVRSSDKDSYANIFEYAKDSRFSVSMGQGHCGIFLSVRPDEIREICRYLEFGRSEKHDLYFDAMEYATLHTGDVETTPTKWNLHWNGVFFWFGRNPKHPYGTYESVAGVDFETAQQMVTSQTFTYPQSATKQDHQKTLERLMGKIPKMKPPNFLIPKTLIDDLASCDKDESPCDESPCRECKGTGKIVLFTSVVDCDCTRG